jgi:hypothetical protein
MRRLAVAFAVLALGAVTPAAEAVTPQQARAVAEQAIAAGPDATPFEARGPLLSAQRRRFRPVVEIHRLRRALRKGALVGQGVERARRGSRVKRRSFMFWGDYAPGAGFVHPSRIVLIDAASGKVSFNRLISWWPEVNGKRVFTRGRGRLARPNVGPARARGAALVPGFRSDCVVTIGDRTDPHFLKGMAAITRMANRTGMPSAAAQRVRDLGPKIDELSTRNPPCKDVMIYIAGHGYAPQNSTVKLPNGDPVARSDEAQVVIKSKAPGGTIVEEDLNFSQVKKIIHDRPHLTFKLVVESCFSGRWTRLMAEPNLRITLTSSRQSEVTFLAVTHAQRGMQVDGTMRWDTSAPVGKPDAASDPPPFTRGVTEAVDGWSENPANQNGELGQALSHAGQNRQGDRARALGWQHGQTDDRTGERGPGPGCQVQPQPPCQPPGQVAYEVSVTGRYRHIGPGSSEVCWDIQTIPQRPDAEVNVQTSSPGVVSGGNQSVRTNSSGFVRVRVRINSFGSYSSSVSVVAQDGAARTGNGNVTVGPEDGTCPAP